MYEEKDWQEEQDDQFKIKVVQFSDKQRTLSNIYFDRARSTYDRVHTDYSRKQTT